MAHSSRYGRLAYGGDRYGGRGAEPARQGAVLPQPGSRPATATPGTGTG